MIIQLVIQFTSCLCQCHNIVLETILVRKDSDTLWEILSLGSQNTIYNNCTLLLHRSVRVWAGHLSCVWPDRGWGWGGQWSVSAVISSVSKVLASPTSTINTLVREMPPSSDTWQHLWTSWTSSFYFTSSGASPTSPVSPSSWMAIVTTLSRGGCSVSITLTPSEASGSACREWGRGWGI